MSYTPSRPGEVGGEWGSFVSPAQGEDRLSPAAVGGEEPGAG